MADLSDAQGGTDSSTTSETTTRVAIDTAQGGQEVPIVKVRDAGEDPEDEPSDPGAVPEPAKGAAVRRLEEELAKRLPESVARALSRAVVDPAKARRELQEPALVRVMGGSALEVIRVDLYSHMVTPSPANPRDSAERRLLIEGDGGARALLPPQPLAGSASVMVVEAADPETMAETINRSQVNLLATNSYEKDIELDGVLVPITVIPMLVRHKNGSPEVAILATVDGSSRTASCHQLLGIQSSQAAYEFGRDPRRMLGLLGELAAALRRVQAGSEEAPPKVRALVVPAQVVIGHVGPDLRRAVQGYLGLQHVSHPKEWTDAGEIEAKADAMLLELRDDGVSEPAVAWYQGNLTASDARAMGLPSSFDERSVELLHTVMDRRKAASRGLRRVDREMQRVRDPKLAEVCADLALRPARATFHRGRADVARKDLQELYGKVIKFSWAYTGRSPEALRDLALQGVRDPGYTPAGIELALLAAYWLVSKGVVKTLYYSQRLDNGQSDRRGVDQIILGMLTSERGVHQLYRVVADSRAGIVNPRSVDGRGDGVFGNNGLPTELTNDRLRSDLVPNRNEPEPMPVPPGETPETALQQHEMKVLQATRFLRQEVDEIKDPRGVTGLLVEERGWPVASAQEIMDALDEVRTEIAHWKRVAINRQATSADADGSPVVDEMARVAGEES